MQSMPTTHYRTRNDIAVYRAKTGADYHSATEMLAQRLNEAPGVLLSSGFEFPGRYSRWDVGFSDPPLRISAVDRTMKFEALNERGEVILRFLQHLLRDCADLSGLDTGARCISATVRPADALVYEEDRTRQRSVFSVLRSILGAFASPEDSFLGLYGAFGYELAFQFEDVRRQIPRQGDERNLVLYLPDTLLVVDHQKETASQYFYDFEFPVDDTLLSTRGLSRKVQTEVFRKSGDFREGLQCDHAPGAYADTVRKALACFRNGDLFEAVPGQTFSMPCRDDPASVFRRLQKQNPAPYGALMNLGQQEYLVAASPEMYVRVHGSRVETCPISGTIRRGSNALEDARQIRTLLNSSKDEAELSMCTDVDRNDKSRVCEPGSVRVIGRRQIELYSRLIHTVDHVEGRLRAGFDALDAFLSHAWAVTVTGAPKQAAIQFIEDHEHSPRRWYGGAMGCLNFNGDLNTGLTIRTIRIASVIAEVRAGATLLADSDPDQEEAETRLKAEALLHALDVRQAFAASEPGTASAPFAGIRVLMVDHRDSFVHTLASYLQEAGAELRTVRAGAVAMALESFRPELVVLSPGPGRPRDFAVSETIRQCLEHDVVVFGVCLGLQGIVEFFGGSLRVMAEPVHGKSSSLRRYEGPLFAGLQGVLHTGRYHSLAADRVPHELLVTARSEDGEVMAVQHRHLPVAAVQFHPESIMTTDKDAGKVIIRNVLAMVAARQCAGGTRTRMSG
jgi:anthranilate synthase